MPRGSWFRKKPGAINTASPVPDGLWSKCPKCGEISFARDVERFLSLCPKCDYHHPLTSRERVSITLDEDSFVEMDADIISADPLKFPDYLNKIKFDKIKTGENEAILTGRGTIEDMPVLLGVAEFGFRAGSMGSACGEKIVRLMEAGIEQHLPVVIFTASGGARMQEGLFSLMQMAKTSAAVARMQQTATPYVVVLTHPTTGGVYASYAALGDMILAEPGAIIGLAGRRVGNQDSEKLPDDFQTSQYLLDHGMLDMVVSRKELRETLGQLIGYLVPLGVAA